MGVGSEVYQAVSLGRRGVGMELKDTYYRQAVQNIAEALSAVALEQGDIFGPAAESSPRGAIR